ncbi:hypothetical protein PVAR5_8269 [Paecilomyces variotii No. 5]|uniref:ER transporter 6TM N-terminal domain-containing protein n=1 Tax=Byssochlamys spectabilis (strain No. 5 / NBRC 109023) TaxID=1356009 RepID=V5FNG1_BYSSN|nr:hypothetical protein PVAR5_8269 [Paecilomyces variotii No. 5]
MSTVSPANEPSHGEGDNSRAQDQPRGQSVNNVGNIEKEDVPEKHRQLIPGWLDHFNARDLKTLFRCWAAAWVACLFILISPTLRELGTASFFACLVLMFLPPSGIVMVFFLGAASLMLGILLAWAWGVIVMKAALAARPGIETQAKLQALQHQAITTANSTGQSPQVVAQVLVYDGYMLDTRVTAVYFCLLCLFIYLLARLRASNAKFTLVQVFGMIITDIFLTVGPLLPQFSGTIPRTLIVPAAIGVGLGLVAAIFLFPQSTSHQALYSIEKLLDRLRNPLELDFSEKSSSTELKGLVKVKQHIITEYKSLAPIMGFLPLDTSFGVWSAEDIISLQTPLRQVLSSALGLLELHISRCKNQMRVNSAMETSGWQKNQLGEKEEGSHHVGHHQLSQFLALLNDLRNPESETILRGTIEFLRQSSAELLPTCIKALDTVMATIKDVNNHRWSLLSSKNGPVVVQNCLSALEMLTVAREGFERETTNRLVGSDVLPFDANGNLSMADAPSRNYLQATMGGMVYQEQLLEVSRDIETLLRKVIAISQDRNKVRLWFPISIEHGLSWLLKKDEEAPVDGPIEETGLETQNWSDIAQEKLRISRGYTPRPRSKFAVIITNTYDWFTSYEGLYSLKLVIVTIALAIPAVVPHSAGFYYREKGLWGLIMGQTALLVYMSDYTYSVIMRLVGTVIGGVIGLVAWYIGSGVGPGNPYGLAAILGAALAIFMWLRLFLPQAFLQATIMGGATMLLVVGYSFDDTHIPQYGNPGIGYHVFWHRLVLVIIGVCASIIVQIFPRPPSAVRYVQNSLSTAIRRLSDHYALTLSTWGDPEPDRMFICRQLALELYESLSLLEGPIALLGWEFSSSPWDTLASLTIKSVDLPESLQRRLAEQVGLLDHERISEIMAVLSVCEQALKTNDAPPELLPTPLLKRIIEHRRRENLNELHLNREMLKDESYRRYCVALGAYVRFVGSLDDLVLVIKEALGESHIVSRDLLAKV